MYKERKGKKGCGGKNGGERKRRRIEGVMVKGWRRANEAASRVQNK